MNCTFKAFLPDVLMPYTLSATLPSALPQALLPGILLPEAYTAFLLVFLCAFFLS